MITLIGTYIGIGLAGVLAIYIVAKILMQHTIRKAPDYYEKHELAQEAEMLKNITVVDEASDENETAEAADDGENTETADEAEVVDEAEEKEK